MAFLFGVGKCGFGKGICKTGACATTCTSFIILSVIEPRIGAGNVCGNSETIVSGISAINDSLSPSASKSSIIEMNSSFNLSILS